MSERREEKGLGLVRPRGSKRYAECERVFSSSGLSGVLFGASSY